jgi:S-adenosylmethionine uptake transporter
MLMVVASFLFATMSLCVKLAGTWYGNGEIVTYRGLIGTVVIGSIMLLKRRSVRTPQPMLHFKRSFFGVVALSLWFYSVSGLPLGTAVTLNYMSSIWLAVFVIAGTLWLGKARAEPRLVLTVLVGFIGVATILKPSVSRDQWHYALAGLVSGVCLAVAYLQVKSLGQAGEPEDRIVFYFSLGGVVAGLLQELLLPGGPAAATTALTVQSDGPGWLGPLTLLGVGLSGTGAQMAMTRAYAKGRTLVNASLQYSAIVFSFLYGVVLFGEPVHGSSVLGMVLVVGAGIVAGSLSAPKPGGAKAAHPAPSTPRHRPHPNLSPDEDEIELRRGT